MKVFEYISIYGHKKLQGWAILFVNPCHLAAPVFHAFFGLSSEDLRPQHWQSETYSVRLLPGRSCHHLSSISFVSFIADRESDHSNHNIPVQLCIITMCHYLMCHYVSP